MILERWLELVDTPDQDEDLDSLYELEVERALELRHFDRWEAGL